MASQALVTHLDTACQKLNGIIGKLSNEPFIQTQIIQLAGEWKKVGDRLSILLSREGFLVYRRKLQLLSKISPRDEHVVKLKEAIVVCRTELSKWTNSVQVAQCTHHEVVENCRARKRERQQEIISITIDITRAYEKIGSLQSEIRTCDYQADECDNTARQLECSAAKAHRMSENHLIVATAGTATTLLVGAILAPITGGASLVVAGVGAAANTAINGAAATAHNNNANSNQRYANKKRMNACQIRQKITEHGRDIRKKENYIEWLRENEDELEDTCVVLGDVEGMIYMLINDIEERHIFIQNVEMLLQQALDNGDALSLVLRALAREQKRGLFRKMLRRKPKYLNSRAEELKFQIEEGTQGNLEDIASPVMILRFSQLEAAKFLEICYLQLKEHPVQAVKVRATANEARIQHGMSSGLMKQFMVTAEFVADELMPMMKKVIKDRKSKIIMDILETVLEKADGMKAEAEKVKDRYDQLRTKVQEHISDVNMRNKEIADKLKKLKKEKELYETMKIESETEQRKMENERRQKLEEITRMRQQRDELLARAVPSDADDETWRELMKMPSPSPSPIDLLQAGLDAVKVPFHLIRQGMRTYGAIRGGQQAQIAIDKEEEQQNKLREQIRERRETTQKRLAHIKSIDLRDASLGDIESLTEALRQLAKVDEMFGEIILFWENMAVFLKSLCNKTGKGKSFVKAIKTKKYAKMFGGTITEAEKDWRKFGSICRAYAMQTDQELRVVYRFLSSPVDLMDITQRETRIKALTYEIENDARQLEY